MGYHIIYRKSFRKELQKVPADSRKRLVHDILALAENPRPHGCKKLEGGMRTYRIRQGDYRAIYDVYDQEIIIQLIKVGHRSDVYRKLR